MIFYKEEGRTGMQKTEKIAIYPGSFDPITLGHLDVLADGAKMFDKVIIAVLNNSSKKCFLSVEQRKELIQQSVKDIPNVEVDSFDGLTVDYAKKKGATILLRGLRAVSDFEYEIISQYRSAIYNILLKNNQIKQHLIKLFSISEDVINNALIINNCPPIDDFD